jgi:hypothetical protein
VALQPARSDQQGQRRQAFRRLDRPGRRYHFINADRKGDNLYTDSVVALDPKTGNLKWYRQEIKHDVWDYDSPYEVMLFKKDGKDVIVHLNKSGFVFVLDKKDGSIENIWPISNLFNFVKDIDRKTGELIGRVELPMNQETLICPSTPFGARGWNSGAYNPKTGLWYNNVPDFCGHPNRSRRRTIPRTTARLTAVPPISGAWCLHPMDASPAGWMRTIHSPANAPGPKRWTSPGLQAC